MSGFIRDKLPLRIGLAVLLFTIFLNACDVGEKAKVPVWNIGDISLAIPQNYFFLPPPNPNGGTLALSGTFILMGKPPNFTPAPPQILFDGLMEVILSPISPGHSIDDLIKGRIFSGTLGEVMTGRTDTDSIQRLFFDTPKSLNNMTLFRWINYNKNEHILTYCDHYNGERTNCGQMFEYKGMRVEFILLGLNYDFPDDDVRRSIIKVLDSWHVNALRAR